MKLVRHSKMAFICLVLTVNAVLMSTSYSQKNDLRNVLGKEWRKWRITDLRNKAVIPKLIEIHDRKVVKAPSGRGKGIELTYGKPLSKGKSMAIKFRLQNSEHSLKKQPSYLYLAIGLKEDKTSKAEMIQCRISYIPTSDQVRWRITPSFYKKITKLLEKRSYFGVFNPLRVDMRSSLAWPDRIRRELEKYISSSEKPVDRWLTLKVDLLADKHLRIYLNGQLLKEIKDHRLNIEGLCRISLSNCLLTSVKFDEIVGNKKFVKVDLSGKINSSKIDGKNIKNIYCQSKTINLNNIPFILTKPDSKGNNHVDVGESWFPEGSLSGYFSGHSGGTGGRWTDPLNSSPYRLQFKIPKGRYKAIHLLAASDTEEDAVRLVTAQFYRPLAGFPESFAQKVPLYTEKNISVEKLPLEFTDNSSGNLFLITVPLDPGRLTGFDDLDAIGLELTKKVQAYIAYPDPTFYSEHASGLPSAVHVFALTLEKPDFELRLKPDAYGNVWSAPRKPVYNAKLKNRGNKQLSIKLVLKSRSYDKSDQSEQIKSVSLEPGKEKIISFTLKPKEYGYYDITLTAIHGKKTWTEKTAMAYLRCDTREKGDWKAGKGPLFGFWQWNGGHLTPPAEKQAYLMALAGSETQHGPIFENNSELMKVAKEHKMVDFRIAETAIYISNRLMDDLAKNMPKKKALNLFIKALEEEMQTSDAIHKNRNLIFFPEPTIGPFSYSIPPIYRGEGEQKRLAPANEKKYSNYLHTFLLGSKAATDKWPGVKNYMPWGDPVFPVMFLRRSKEFRKALDGVAIDIPGFEHLPEKQFHQVAMHRMHILKNELRKAGVDKVELSLYEGVHCSDRPGALTPYELATHTVRNLLILMGYGVENLASGTASFECADYWGEQHYGGGAMNRIPFVSPKPVYAAFATMTRQLNRCNFIKWIPTGSLTVYCLKFKHYKTGKSVYVLWTIRGERKVEILFNGDAKVAIYNQMDNIQKFKRVNGGVSFTISSAPCYVQNLSDDITVSNLGEPNHSDAKPARYVKKLSNFGNGTWRIDSQPDLDYENSFKEWVKRYPSKMTVKTVKAPVKQGGEALAVHLCEPVKDLKYMPYYTCLKSNKGIVIPGKATALGMWVKASSDWGRVVFVVIDAKGEKWISVGKKGAWNCDDIHNWSYFNFDGWRYLRFPLPSNAPYDCYRENGSTWWGTYSKGDKIIDLPLKLDKVIIERRTNAMYVNSSLPTRKDDVLLANFFAEYEMPENMTLKTVELSKVRMTLPEDAPVLNNPIEEMRTTGNLPPSEITGIRIDNHIADGTRCFVDFNPVEKADAYDVWVSCYKSGQGAQKLGRNWKNPGGMIRGLKPDTDFYIFVTYTLKNEGRRDKSKPSQSYKINLKDMFGNK